MKKFNDVIFSVKIKIQNKFYASVALIRAIFRNMIENSLKYSKEKGHSSYIKIEIVELNDGLLQIKIIDNGIGIKEEHQERIFEMFYRGNQIQSGTGLGLYIVKTAIDKLDGTVACESIVNEGTTFVLTIPNANNQTKLKQKILQKMELAV